MLSLQDNPPPPFYHTHTHAHTVHRALHFLRRAIWQVLDVRPVKRPSKAAPKQRVPLLDGTAPNAPDLTRAVGAVAALIPRSWGCGLAKQMRMQLCDVSDHFIQAMVLSMARQPRSVFPSVRPSVLPTLARV